ncbi:hypothetical protein [Ferrovibrio sp.]|uniref:hypothetical protein n=1 Tax=Ferrovibrio sp. TaxID=1917215 RepID=UPI00311DB162
MRDIPIIFSAPMVRALLDGRKSQTRRLAWHRRTERPSGCMSNVDTPSSWQKVKTGDRLWVRETVAAGACAPSKPSEWSPSFWAREQGCIYNPSGLWYEADDTIPERTISSRGKWAPSIHMPRWASRLTLVVTATKIERLQDICEIDAHAEGIAWCDRWQGFTTNPGAMGGEHYHAGDPCKAFASLWISLHGPESWADNPEVVALTFTVHRANVDHLTTPA